MHIEINCLANSLYVGGFFIEFDFMGNSILEFWILFFLNSTTLSRSNKPLNLQTLLSESSIFFRNITGVPNPVHGNAQWMRDVITNFASEYL